jgi:hypothetical protein
MDPQYNLWYVLLSPSPIHSIQRRLSAASTLLPRAPATLLSYALQIDPRSLEALQTLASVRLSQEKQDEALVALRTFPSPPDASDAQSHAILLLNALPVQTRIARAKLLLECSAYPDALALLEGVPHGLGVVAARNTDERWKLRRSSSSSSSDRGRGREGQDWKNGKQVRKAARTGERRDERRARKQERREGKARGENEQPYQLVVTPN